MEEAVKNNISCNECEVAIVEGSYQQDQAVLEHIANCSACRDFMRFQQDVLSAEYPRPMRIPELAAIRKEAQRRKTLQRNWLRFAVMPGAAAAAAALALAGFYWQMQPSAMPENGQWQAAYQVLDDDLLTNAWETSEMTLAWDQSSSFENECRKSVRAAADLPDWSIEIFNPYIEE